ncbi:AimR family lysis-lysogeny pheromone receptor [Virgibacillus sp. JSM 102003]|uniref:AimR family lysis-lysogeny pheromone receptor n=1 Tax=Virgibacillus sp. JSM 102003 TaxID=1562108 RepID=UPI0035C18A77
MPNSIITMASDDQYALEQVLQVLRQEHDEHTADRLARNFCLQTTSNEISKKGMEFLYMNGHYDDLQKLINKNKKSSCKSNRNWAAVYQVTIDRKFRMYLPSEIIRQLRDIRTDEPELQSLMEFIKINIYHSMNDFSQFGNSLEKQQYLFEKIEDRFLLSFFQIRLNQSLFIYYLIRNEVIMARKYAFRVLNDTTSPNTKINIHTNLGFSYLYDTYFQGMYHMSEALKIAKKHDLQKSITVTEQKNIPFLSAHFKKTEGVTSTDKSEQAHIEIAKGNNAKAESILNEIPIDSPFKMYYLGMAKQDKYILLKSYNSFIENRSDYFFSRMPLQEIRKMGA